MGDAAKPLQSLYEQLLSVPEHLTAEIIRGALVTHPRPASPHARAATRLSRRLGPFDDDDGPGGWIILIEPELHLGQQVLVPDLAGWRRERMPAMPHVPFFDLAPDWVCEVLSSSTQAVDRGDKLPIYAEHGVSHAWLIDPVARLLEAYRLEAGRWLLLGTHRDAARVRAEPFASIELELDDLWAT